MDPVIEPACAVCGATTDLVWCDGDWVCADHGDCTERHWMPNRPMLHDMSMAEGIAAGHLYGRCTCGGEGQCEWCKRSCPACGVKTIEHGDTCIDMQRACDRCGGLQNVYLLRHSWQCDFCLSGDLMPDYEALGYPEAETGELPHLESYGSMWRRIFCTVDIATEKDIPAATDIVDSAAKDSY